MRTPLAVASVLEVLTGLALLVVPQVVTRLLLGGEVGGAGIAVSRVAGIALIALGVACWPSGATIQALKGMLAYDALVAAFLAYLGIGGEWVGKLLWPAVALHVILTVLLARAWFNADKAAHMNGTSP